MGTIPIDTKELPRDWRRVMTLFGVMALGGALVFGADMRMRIVAKETAREAIKEDLEPYKEAALNGAKEAAATAASEAVRNVYAVFIDRLNELDRRETKHEAADDQ